jgi:hypothetical protein
MCVCVCLCMDGCVSAGPLPPQSPITMAAQSNEANVVGRPDAGVATLNPAIRTFASVSILLMMASCRLIIRL